jgi:hypothetical protein
MRLMDELQRKPFPKCAHCDTRAHGLFVRRMKVREPLPDDSVLESHEARISYRDPKDPTKRRSALVPIHTVDRMMLLCSSCGFSLGGTELVRSLNTQVKPTEPPPEAKLLGKAITATELWTKVRREQLKSSVSPSILNQYRRTDEDSGH